MVHGFTYILYHCLALSTQCSAEELVKILNDLFARWEKLFFLKKYFSAFLGEKGYNFYVVQSLLQLNLGRKTQFIYMQNIYWDWIIGRNPDKSLKSYPPYYSESPLQLYLEIYISSNSRNLLQFLQFILLYTVKEKGGKPIGNHTPYPTI